MLIFGDYSIFLLLILHPLIFNLLLDNSLRFYSELTESGRTFDSWTT